MESVEAVSLMFRIPGRTLPPTREPRTVFLGWDLSTNTYCDGDLDAGGAILYAVDAALRSAGYYIGDRPSFGEDD